MIFSFIRYTQPGWQFNVLPAADIEFSSCYFHPELLPLPPCVGVEVDNTFESASAQNADIGYRAWNMGALIRCDKRTADIITAPPKPTLNDEYRFVFKYWGKPWALFALLQRIATLKNPFSEIKAYRKASIIKRFNPYKNPIEHSEYKAFESSLVQQMPLVSVIIPTLNRYEYLRDVLNDLQQQDYKNFEVIIVDQSNPFDETFYKSFKLQLHVVHQQERLLWTARNNAVKLSKADYLLFFDDDSRVAPNWISEHVKALDFFKADISAGVSLAKVGMKIPESYSYFRWADQFDSGNVLVKRHVFEKIGLFDEQYNKQRMGDGEFGLRAYLHGFKSISNPNASRIHLKVPSGGLREMGSWDAFRPKKWFAPKPIPSVVFLYKKYFPRKNYLSMMLLGVMLSNVHYKNKGNSKMLVLSVLLTVLKSPVLLIQFLRARSIANEMLRKDNGIQLLQP